MAAIPTQGLVDEFVDAVKWGLGVPLLLVVVVSIIMASIDHLRYGPATTCPDCGHPSNFHSNPHCLGSVIRSDAFAPDDGPWCPCTLTQRELKGPKRGKHRPKD